jgi:hypothetical protein
MLVKDALEKLTRAISSQTKIGDSIHIDKNDEGKFTLKEAKSTDVENAIISAYESFLPELTIGEKQPTFWMINGTKPINEIVYSYRYLGITITYGINAEAIWMHSQTNHMFSIESETHRIKAKAMENIYLELLFGENAVEVGNILADHGLKFEKLDVN